MCAFRYLSNRASRCMHGALKPSPTGIARVPPRRPAPLTTSMTTTATGMSFAKSGIGSHQPTVGLGRPLGMAAMILMPLVSTLPMYTAHRPMMQAVMGPSGRSHFRRWYFLPSCVRGQGMLLGVGRTSRVRPAGRGRGGGVSGVRASREACSAGRRRHRA